MPFTDGFSTQLFLRPRSPYQRTFDNAALLEAVGNVFSGHAGCIVFVHSQVVRVAHAYGVATLETVLEPPSMNQLSAPPSPCHLTRL
jgi:hypothetical protein